MKKLLLFILTILLVNSQLFSQCDNPPPPPTDLACYEEAVFDDDFCEWYVIGEDTTPEPAVVTLSGGTLTATGGSAGLGFWVDCATEEPFMATAGMATFTPTANGIYTYVILNATMTCYGIGNCVEFSQCDNPPPPPTDLACYEEAVFDADFCEWYVIGEMPEEPTDLACYEEAVFDEDFCEWYVIGEDTTPEPAVVTLSGGTLTATGGSAGLGFWVDCATEEPFMATAGMATFTPTANGIYTYVILNATMTCYGIGNCVEVGFISLDEKDEVLFSIAPNPSNGIFTLKNPSLIDGVIVITDGSGRIIYESSLDASEKSIDISNVSIGIYYLNVKSNNNNKVIRLIKN